MVVKPSATTTVGPTSIKTRMPRLVRLVVISDTHGHRDLLTAQKLLPPGDILVHCGDFSHKGFIRQDAQSFRHWISSSLTQYPEKFVVEGNHDHTRDDDPDGMNLPAFFADSGVRLLQDESIILSFMGHLGGRVRRETLHENSKVLVTFWWPIGPPICPRKWPMRTSVRRRTEGGGRDPKA
jgi:hypothetical protein